jgi:hypothetical protein
MAKLTDEHKAQRAAARRRREALAAEAEHERREAKHREWRDTGAYLTREELEAGEACRGCGLPVMDRQGDWPWPKDRTADEQAAYDVAEADFRARHPDCHAGRWSLSGSRSYHCFNCCPPHPMSQSQIAQIAAILRSHEPKPEELDTWRLTLTCKHSVDRTMHHSNRTWTTGVVDCATCGTHRGVVEAERLESVPAQPAGRKSR